MGSPVLAVQVERQVNMVLLVDTETTGVDDSARCIEIAATLFSVRHAAPVRSFSSLIRAEENPAENVNRIPVALLREAPRPEPVWNRFFEMVPWADAIVAHNADFDRRFVPSVESSQHIKPWICSMDDLAWPKANRPGEGLVSLALAHGLGVAHAHRAAADVELLGRLLTRIHEMGTKLNSFLARGLRPKALFMVAETSFDAERNERAKAHGFVWDRAMPRRWARKMAIEDAQALPFAVVQVES